MTLPSFACTNVNESRDTTNFNPQNNLIFEVKVKILRYTKVSDICSVRSDEADL